MDLQNLFFVTQSIFAIIASLVFVVLGIFLIVASKKIKNILNNVRQISENGMRVSEKAGLYLDNVLESDMSVEELVIRWIVKKIKNIKKG